MKPFGSVADPPTVVTTTVAGPGDPGGTSKSIRSKLEMMRIAALPPIVTEYGLWRSVPRSVPKKPPVVEPLDGDTELIVGGGVTKVNASGSVAVPPGVVSETAAAPLTFGDVTTVTVVALTTVNPDAK